MGGGGGRGGWCWEWEGDRRGRERGDRRQRQMGRSDRAHNAGAGSLLLAKAKAELPRGFSLWTFQANLGARRFYERHGLAEARRTNGAANEEGLPDILYEWRP